MNWSADKAKDEFYKMIMESKGVNVLAEDFLGKGSHARIYGANYSRRSEKVVVKLIDRRDADCIYLDKCLPREVLLLPTLKHPNVIEVFVICENLNFTAFVQEFAENGTLQQMINKKGRIPESQSQFLLRQLIEAIKYLESMNIIHRDIKGDNIFLDRYNNVKLGDFGLARILLSSEISNSQCGTEAFMAPELLKGLDYRGNGCDVWSAGVTLHNTLTGSSAFLGQNQRDVVANQQSHTINFPANAVSAKAEQLIRHMLHPTIELRASTQQIIESSWLEGCSYYMRTQIGEQSLAANDASSQRANKPEKDFSEKTCIDDVSRIKEI
uniref:Protein kinase domain-containing protein n=1 Tax=Ditylenchus dipsaci TaxID=166011 RepID=A0A915D0V0_9BILA